MGCKYSNGASHEYPGLPSSPPLFGPVMWATVNITQSRATSSTDMRFYIRDMDLDLRQGEPTQTDRGYQGPLRAIRGLLGTTGA